MAIPILSATWLSLLTMRLAATVHGGCFYGDTLYISGVVNGKFRLCEKPGE